MVLGVGASVGVEKGMDAAMQAVVDDDEGEPIVVSVGLLPSPSPSRVGATTTTENVYIYPLDTFTLDIFVFNKSSWTRRFEVSYPERRKMRKLGGDRHRQSAGKDLLRDGEKPGILPLQNRVRIG
jgi:hypothetical protein